MEGKNKKQEQKKFIIGRVSTERKTVLLAFKDAKHLFEKGSVWEVLRILLPNRYPSGTLVLRKAGGLQDEQGREIYIKKTIEGELLKALLKEYGFRKAVDAYKYMLVRVLEDGSLSVEVANDRIGGYKWVGWGWKYIANLQEEQEEDIEL